jgi:alpha-L-rhamnosidase
MKIFCSHKQIHQKYAAWFRRLALINFGFLLSVIFLTPIILYAQNENIVVKGLRTEYLKNPEGIDMAHPRFSWVLSSNRRNISQKAYRILVAGNRYELLTGKADLWDSHKVISDKSVNVEYNGKSFKSDQTYYWKVKVWNQDNEASQWSKVNFFHTGLLKKSDWQGEWIGAKDTTISAPLLRKGFTIDKEIKSAYVFVVGLGYYELYLNGEKVGNHVLDPGTSDYNKRALYVTYNVKKYLEKGENAIGVWLGNGYFRMRTIQHYGDSPQLLLQMNIRYTDGTVSHIVSNTTWKTSASPIIANSIYDGEIFDARKEKPGWNLPGYNDGNWNNAVKVSVPKSRKLSPQLMPPIRIVKTLYPISMSEPVKGIYVFDFGQNLTGWPELYVNGGEGQKVIMKTAEVTAVDMAQLKGEETNSIIDTIDAVSDRSAKARDIYILAGKPGVEIYEPKFTYHGFRYVQVEGYPGKPNLTSIAAKVVHTDVTPIGNFNSSNSLFNRIHYNVLWGQESNLFSIPTDCPQRDERMGWMADADLSAEEAIHNFNMAAFYTNWIREIQDDQNKDGSVPDLVPHHKWSGVGTPAWQVAYPLMIWYMHKYYGDVRIMKEHYNSLKKWMNYMASISHKYIITRGRGDWVPPELSGGPNNHSVAITSTGYYYKSAKIMAHIAGILGKGKDSVMYSHLASSIKHAFNNRFWDVSKNIYGTGSQTENAFPLYLGIVPKDRQQEVVKSLVNNIMLTHDGHLWTGIIGTKALIEALPEYNQTNILYTITNQTTYPGWGYMISKGATTLWERWGAYRYFNAEMNSLNHIMYGSIDEFFYKDLAGIKVKESGFKQILINPHIVGNLTFAKASVKTVRGLVASSWNKKGDQITLNVTIPPNSQAEVDIPKANLHNPFIVKESGRTIWEKGTFKKGVPGINSAKEDRNYIIVNIGSGDYKFELKGQ